MPEVPDPRDSFPFLALRPVAGPFSNTTPLWSAFKPHGSLWALDELLQLLLVKINAFVKASLSWHLLGKPFWGSIQQNQLCYALGGQWHLAFMFHMHLNFRNSISTIFFCEHLFGSATMSPTPPHPTPGRRLNLNHDVYSACLREGLTRNLVDEKINISRPEKLAHAEAGSQSGLISDFNSTLR